MKLITRFIVSALTIMLVANFLPGIKVDGFITALWVAFAISLLNIFLKPLLVLFTLPITIVTLGLFLFIINAIVVLTADFFVDGFQVGGLWSALLFSIVYSVVMTILEKILGIK